MLPLDVSNFRNSTNMDMKIMWYIIYMTSAFFIVIILPFALFYYESDEDKTFVSIIIPSYLMILRNRIEFINPPCFIISNYNKLFLVL